VSYMPLKTGTKIPSEIARLAALAHAGKAIQVPGMLPALLRVAVAAQFIALPEIRESDSECGVTLNWQ
jgi:hypothetical protein